MTNLKIAASNEAKIDKGIPLPSPNRGAAPAWPLRAMEVGDSFSIDGRPLTALRSAISYEQRINPGKKFTVRTLPTETRCWRIA